MIAIRNAWEWLRYAPGRRRHRSYLRGYDMAAGNLLRGQHPVDVEAFAIFTWAPTEYDQGILDACRDWTQRSNPK